MRPFYSDLTNPREQQERPNQGLGSRPALGAPWRWFPGLPSWARRVSNLRPLACEARTRRRGSARFAGKKREVARAALRDPAGSYAIWPGVSSIGWPKPRLVWLTIAAGPVSRSHRRPRTPTTEHRGQRACEVRGGRGRAGLDSTAQMAVVGSSEELVDLLCAAARTPGGEVGLLKTAQVARILGRRRDWVHRNAGRLGGFRLPGSDEWRFSPRGVAIGVLGPHDATSAGVPGPRPAGRRLAYPPAKQTLADRPRRANTDQRGGPDAPPGPRYR